MFLYVCCFWNFLSPPSTIGRISSFCHMYNNNIILKLQFTSNHLYIEFNRLSCVGKSDSSINSNSHSQLQLKGNKTLVMSKSFAKSKEHEEHISISISLPLNFLLSWSNLSPLIWDNTDCSNSIDVKSPTWKSPRRMIMLIVSVDFGFFLFLFLIKCRVC